MATEAEALEVREWILGKFINYGAKDVVVERRKGVWMIVVHTRFPETVEYEMEAGQHKVFVPVVIEAPEGVMAHAHVAD